MKLGHRIGLVDDYCYQKCMAIFRYFHKSFKILVKNFENNGKNTKNIVKLNLEQSIISAV